MKTYYLIDAGSSSIKLYQYSGKKPEMIYKESYELSKPYLSSSKLTLQDQKTLINIFLMIKENYKLSRINTKIFATGHFRRMTNINIFKRELYFSTGLCFHVISQELELFYLEKVFLSYSKGHSKVLVFNIGSGSIELVFMENGQVMDRKMIDFGVKKVSKEICPEINNVNDKYLLTRIVDRIIPMLPDANNSYTTAFYTGGELTFMKRCQYPLSKMDNKDSFHPFKIDYSEYCNYNEALFSKMSIEDLHALMPENPKWMDGARPCSAIAQAICKKYCVKNIIPSDFNMVDGISIQQARNVVICGSFRRNLDEIRSLITKLHKQEIMVYSPQNTIVTGEVDGFVLLKNDHPINGSNYSIECKHLDAIANKECDMVIVCNSDDNVGDSTSMEVGFALALGKRIVFLNDNETSRLMDGPFEIGIIGD